MILCKIKDIIILHSKRLMTLAVLGKIKIVKSLFKVIVNFDYSILVYQ